MSGAPPPSFAETRQGACVSWVRASWCDAWREAGLQRPQAWLERIADGPVSGRGAIARLTLPGLPPLVLKQLRRGGLAARLWRDRFPGTGRLKANLTLPLAAIERGIATPRPAALLVEAAGVGLWRGWLATEEIVGGRDLGRLLAERPDQGTRLLTAALAELRRAHDAGLVHPDLNLGNLLLTADAPRPSCWILDLDGARLAGKALSAGRRLRTLQRLERSYVKRFGDRGPFGREWGASWPALYAGADRRLAERLDLRRGAGRLRLALHQGVWRLRE